MSLARIALLLALAMTSASASATVVDAKPNGFTIDNSVNVAVDADTAWKALVEHVDDWWPKAHSWFGKSGKFQIQSRVGGCFCETAGDRQALHMTVSFVDPGRLLRMLGGLGPLQGMGLSGAMDWRFEPIADGTHVTLHYVAGGYTTEDLVKFSAIVDHVQGEQLNALAEYLSKRAKP
ncbi:MAG TPA: SRPBCC domain-containing protein [Nevskiaceae bacterium]|nr:SRPBCC domain-containing protein [Nevskiaceae bacterium]